MAREFTVEQLKAISGALDAMQAYYTNRCRGCRGATGRCVKCTDLFGVAVTAEEAMLKACGVGP
jgi:hypothetical protein